MAGSAVTAVGPPIDNGDVQGLVRFGYGRRRSAAYLLLHVEDAAAARRWLAGLAVTSAAASEDVETVINIAFTFAGLRAVGLAEEALIGFPPEFEEGLAGNPHRSAQLGDLGDSAPETWQWGGPADRVHAVLIVYATDDAALESCLQRGAALPQGIALLRTLSCRELPADDPHPGLREHFGFRDGLSQPDVIGWDDDGPAHNRVVPGEFLLGYPNAYGQMNESPRVPDGGDLLPDGDFGRNGTYLVLRQLEQDVTGFWSCLLRAAAAPTTGALGTHRSPAAAAAAIRLAAKMVGRWPDGMPLVLAPDTDPGTVPANNDFGYASEDMDGTRCPLGAHIRRSNPRDGAFQPNPEDPADNATSREQLSLEVVNRHRIIRRGRPYGRPLAPSLEPRDLIAAALAGHRPDEEERGLFFVCLNASLSRQFELIQHTWLNNTEFVTGCPEQDPLLGDCADAHPPSFTMQGRPLATTATDLQRFVHVRGGAYFFLPSLSALRYLSR